mmetsp:Transcript_8173/g.10993  ORF Transcript_8173/g.10993 Transcript_8173/m.10993 type:complete len:195 (-) Transcript_8173:281-865(-)
MKAVTTASAFAIVLLASSTEALVNPALSTVRSSSKIVAYGYIPDGFTADSYKKFKEEEAKKKKKNLGGLGPRGFKSRSMQSFQEAMERGEAAHLLPVFNAKERIAKGELKPEDIPVSNLENRVSIQRRCCKELISLSLVLYSLFPAVHAEGRFMGPIRYQRCKKEKMAAVRQGICRRWLQERTERISFWIWKGA